VALKSIAPNASDDVPRIVVGDSARTMQVFTNLLGNSIKFTSKGRILVRGRLTNPDSNGQRRRSFGSFSLDRVTDTAPTSEIVIVFEVDDTGPGIDPALWEKVFENFVQGDASTTRIHGGTGLGLGIVRSLVQLMGGKIRIVEKSGPGSLFQFTLCFDSPLQYETVPFQLSPLFHGAEVILGIPDGDCRAVAVHWLENEGLTVHQVETWEHILQHLRAINCSSKHHKRDAVEVCAGTVKQCSSDSIQQLALGLEFSENPPSPKRPSMYDFWKSWTNIGTRLLHDSPRQLMIIDTSLLPRVVTQDKLQDFLQESGFLTGAHKHCLDAHGLEKLDLNEWQTIRQRDLLVIWIVASNTPEPVKAALDSVCNSILVRKPLHAARFKELFQQIAQEEGDPIPITKLEKSPIVLSSNVIHYVRQQEWGDPYDCKTELPYAPSTNHVQQCYGQQHPSATATATAPAEKDSWQTPSEPKLASAVDSTPDLACISLEEEQSSQSSRTVCKTVTRNCRSRRKLSVSKGVDSLSRPLDKLDILVAEDNPLLRKLAVAMLRRLGATTHEASNGKEALEAVMIRVQGGERSFHCILMDCQMPVMDGYEACMALRAFENEGIQRTCIIALTANAMASDEQKCLNAGMDAFLTKPINEEYMVQIILRTVCPDTQSVS
jgi:CheY-like chemotaxis protein